ncbi:hypothetical protein RclHR1_04260014 [Rhizophagus clarus]|uniref:BTB domain-containing protein n=1 Tax=Rhizophagus clarus TaxID=94130 RepID=A0A2Z6RHP5_9GLOM|nr:hypothetical protein RclHR1_04260014 [Rhizophagus clarus]GES87649.1 hypothetical protein GLOIN_2v1470532 [Rhizophagus clarus]
MTLTFHSNLLKDLSLILNDADDYDVIIEVGENQNIKEFRAHSVILRARSPYFKGALSANWITKKDDMIMFNKPNVTSTVFEMILKYFYTGEIDFTKQSDVDILGFLVATDELLLEELFEHVQDYLINEKTSWIDENLVLVLHAVFKLDNCKKLHDYCLDSICEDPLQFFTSDDFPSINKEIFLGLLKRDDLQIKEIAIWEYLIKWGIEQTPDLRNNKAEWNNESHEVLKKTLDQFIPLIRFVGISREEFFDKVRPYKAIIPNHIYEEIEEFYYKDNLPKTTILPPRTGFSNNSTGNFKSKIINKKLANIIVNWIDKKDAEYARTINDPSYKFKLIYLGSRVGINNELFKIKCNGRLASLVLVKGKKSNKIFGGYSSIGFNKLGDQCLIENNIRYYHSTDNFIFSFENSEDAQNMKIGRVINKQKAILEYFNNGFNFGWGSFCMYSHQNFQVNNRDFYEEISPYYIYDTISEIETFIIIKR